MSELLSAIKNIWLKYKVQIILGVALLITVLCLLKSLEVNSHNRSIYNNNLAALTEQVETWKTKNGDLVAEKTVLEGDVKLLKQTNEELYEQVKSLKAKPKEVVYVNVEVPYPVHDTTFIVNDSSYVKKTFDFSNEWRALSGYIEYDKPNLGLTIDKDIFYTDFTVAIRDSKIYVTSNNPYVQYSDIQGVVVPKKKPKWSLGVGPQFGVGYDVVNKVPGIYAGIGISFNYNIFTF